MASLSARPRGNLDPSFPSRLLRSTKCSQLWISGSSSLKASCTTRRFPLAFLPSSFTKTIKSRRRVRPFSPLDDGERLQFPSRGKEEPPNPAPRARPHVSSTRSHRQWRGRDGGTLQAHGDPIAVAGDYMRVSIAWERGLSIATPDQR